VAGETPATAIRRGWCPHQPQEGERKLRFERLLKVISFITRAKKAFARVNG